jgi:hypothetical protein
MMEHWPIIEPYTYNESSFNNSMPKSHFSNIVAIILDVFDISDPGISRFSGFGAFDTSTLQLFVK